MADWLRLPSGQAINMDRVVTITRPPHSAPGVPEELTLRTCDGERIVLLGPELAALRRYLERVSVGERTDDEKPPRGRDNLIRKW